MANFKLKLRIFWLFLVIFILLFLSWQKVSPFGDWTCQQSFKDNSVVFLSDMFSGRSCLSKVSPSDRAIDNENGPLIVLADPVYFSVFTPRSFSRAEVTITYRPHLSSSTPIIEAGFLADNKLWRYDLQPVYNLWLEKGLSDWDSLSLDDLHLFQRNKKFDSIFDFLDTWQNNKEKICSSPHCLAVYNFNVSGFPSAIDLDSLSQNSNSLIFPYNLRGAHQFYFYLNEEELSLSGEFIDRNENKDKDDIELDVYYGQKNIASLFVEDEGTEVEGSGDRSVAKPFVINRKDLKPGLYRLDFRVNDDIMLSNLKINSGYFSALHKIWIEGDKKVDLITDAPYIQVKAVNPAALQIINFDERDLKINKIYSQYEINSKAQFNDWHKLSYDHGGLILENNGVFALNSESILNPDYPRLDRSTVIGANLDYVLANYTLATPLADAWLQSSLDFSTANFYRENGEYNLILSIPGLKLEQSGSGYVEIGEIKIKFYGNSLWQKIKDWLNL